MSKTLRLTTLAVFSAVAFLMTIATHNISFMTGYSFLTLDMKDVVIVLAGFQYGPVAVALISLVVSLIEMMTISSTGFVGLIMNVIATCSFACVAAFVYERRKTFTSGIIGLVLGVLCATVMMLLWNLIITPLYQGVPRSVIQAALLPVFLPFNLIKNGINAVATVALYNPLIHILNSRAVKPQGAEAR